MTKTDEFLDQEMAVIGFEEMAMLGIAPRQAQILALMQEDYDQEWSSKTLADRLGWTIGATAYHVRTLHGDGWLRHVREGRVRGAVQHWYRLNVQTLAAGADRCDSLRTIAEHRAVTA